MTSNVIKFSLEKLLNLLFSAQTVYETQLKFLQIIAVAFSYSTKQRAIERKTHRKSKNKYLYVLLHAENIPTDNKKAQAAKAKDLVRRIK